MMDARGRGFSGAERIRRAASRSQAAAAILLLAAFAGCRSPEPADGTGTLYRHNWWNYYARGAALLKQGRTAEAQADFQRCLGLIRGAKFANPRDMWRARTYGLHFVEGYFPNRELGVCHYELREYAQAVRFLETSLRLEPSARAKHYLNLARRHAMQSAAHTLAPPRVTTELSSGAAFTRERDCLVRGTASGAGRIRRLTVGGAPQYIELAQTEQLFSRRVPLRPGTNVVTVEAEDLLGRRGGARIVRIADWQPPRLVIRRVTPSGKGWRVEGICRDAFGIAEVSFGGEAVYRRSGDETLTDVAFSLRIPPAGATVAVTDLAGNKLLTSLGGDLLSQTASAVPRQPVPSGMAEHGTVLARMDAHAARAAYAGRAAAARPRFAALEGPAPAEADRLRPSLTLSSARAVTRVFAEEFYLDGTAADSGGLAAVSVNGENLLAPDDRGALRSCFARRLPLDPGTNRFDIAAADRAGNRALRTLTVIRLEPEHREERFRLSVGVPPLVPAEAGAVSVRVKRSLEAGLTRAPVRFRLLERDEGWDFVLREQGLSLSELSDPSAALRIGKLVPADMLLLGTVIREASGVTVYLKAVETESGEVLFASDVYSPDTLQGLEEAVAGLALKIHQGFPLIDGAVLRRQGSRVTLSIGRDAGAAEHSRFVVVRADADGKAEEGCVRLHAGRAVQVRIERIRPDTSLARIVPAEADETVKEGDYVYSR